jgi:hypothetical protein
VNTGVTFTATGMIAQEIVLMEPQLVRKMIIAGRAPPAAKASAKWPV